MYLCVYFFVLRLYVMFCFTPVCVDILSNGCLRIPVANGLTDDKVGGAAIGQEGGQSYSSLNALHAFTVEEVPYVILQASTSHQAQEDGQKIKHKVQN